jgi:ankyrin repeat protein
LHWASEYGHKDLAELLLVNRADVNAKDMDGLAPLHLAAAPGDKAMVEWLLANKAEVNAKDNNGQTPLTWASSSKLHSQGVIELLRLYGGHQ